MTLADTKTRRKIKIKKAPNYCNVFYNNDKTPMDVVIFLLMNIFNLSVEDATTKTTEIHESKKGIIHINSKEICDFKCEMARQHLAKLKENHLKQTVELYSEDN